MVMFQYSICDMHFGIKQSELILGISVGILLVFSDKLFFLILARCQMPFFAKKKIGMHYFVFFLVLQSS